MLLELLIGSAHAADEAAKTASQSPIAGMVPMILVFAIFYFLMIRPQQKKLKEEQGMLSSLAKGDEVYTKSGMLGVVYGLTDKIVTLELAEGIKVKFLRSQIGGLSKTVFEKDSKKGK